MLTLEELRTKLKNAKKRNKDAFCIIGAVSGFGEKAVKEIASGKREPALHEIMTLSALA